MHLRFLTLSHFYTRANNLFNERKILDFPTLTLQNGLLQNGNTSVISTTFSLLVVFTFASISYRISFVYALGRWLAVFT